MSKKTDSERDSMFMGASTRQGYEIAAKSREIVRSLIDVKIKNFTPAERSIIERIVHSTADPEYAEITRISKNFVDESLMAISEGEDILTDIKMVKVGINKYAGKVKCYISHEKTLELAKNREITRAAAAMELAALEGFEGMVAIGNSPTALWKIIELVKNRDMDVKSVIGVPVGFVGATESKKALEQSSMSYLLTRGPKGGTPVAVATVNSLINMVRERVS
jgi:precorrin-8X/cobalt-precorrin-8 methylmutase